MCWKMLPVCFLPVGAGTGDFVLAEALGTIDFPLFEVVIDVDGVDKPFLSGMSRKEVSG